MSKKQKDDKNRKKTNKAADKKGWKNVVKSPKKKYVSLMRRLLKKFLKNCV